MPSRYSTDPNLPNFARAEYIAREPDLQLIADEIGGTRTMHNRSTTYIRKWGGETRGNYNIRRQCESFFEGFGRTLSAAVGMLFAKSPSVEWNQSEEIISPHWDNIDGAGANGPVFVKRFAEAALRDGFSVILVDHPSPPDGVDVVTGDVEQTFNLRPMWRRYDRLDAINWLVEIVDNVATLTQVTLVESAKVRVGTFGTKAVTRYRDLRLVTTADANGVQSRAATWTLRELSDGVGSGNGTFKEIGTGIFRNRAGETRSTLPIAIAYTGRTDAPMEAVPPLLGVAWANLHHWQLSTSLRFNSEVAGFAQPVVVGDLMPDPVTGAPQKLEIGPLVSVHIQQGGEFQWAEVEGSGLERLALLVLEKLRQIAALGVSFLQSDTRAAETAEAKRLDAEAENATLATAATGIQDAVNLALEHHAWFVGIEKAGAPVLTISHDFGGLSIDPAYLTVVLNAYIQGAFTLEELRYILQTGKMPDDFDASDQKILNLLANEAARQQELKNRQADALAAAGQNGNANGNANGNGAGNNPPPPASRARATA